MRSLVIEDFPGLDLRGDYAGGGPGRCEVALDVLLKDGLIQPRPPFLQGGFYADAQEPKAMWGFTSAAGTNEQLVSRADGLYYRTGQLGVTNFGAGLTNLSANVYEVGAHWAGPGARYLFLTDASAGTAPALRYSGGGAPGLVGAGIPFVGAAARYVCPWRIGNRMAWAGFGGNVAGDNPSSVWISNEGAPETFAANQYVDLQPGEADGIVGMCSYGEQLFVFKHRTMFVFYAIGDDERGDDVFHWRTVDLPGFLATHRSICVTPMGVVVGLEDGLHVTTGGALKPIGAEVRDLWTEGNQGSTNYRQVLLRAGWSGIPSARQEWITWSDGRLYVSLGGYLLVWDVDSDRWMLWQRSEIATLPGLPITTVDYPVGSWLVVARYHGTAGGAHEGYSFASIASDEGVPLGGTETQGLATEQIYGRYRFTRGEHDGGVSVIRRTRYMVRARSDDTSLLGVQMWDGPATEDGSGNIDDFTLSINADMALGADVVGGGRLTEVWDLRSRRGREFQYELRLTNCAVHKMEIFIDSPRRGELAHG